MSHAFVDTTDPVRPENNNSMTYQELLRVHKELLKDHK